MSHFGTYVPWLVFPNVEWNLLAKMSSEEGKGTKKMKSMPKVIPEEPAAYRS